MKPKPRFAWKWLSTGAGLLSWLAAVAPTHATGYYGPSAYLVKGGQQVDEAPEFYWDLEVKRLAGAFRPADAPAFSWGVFPPQLKTGDDPEDPAIQHPKALTKNLDVADFAAALKEGKLKPPNAAAAQRQHEAARAVLAGLPEKPAPLPEEFASEFADYHRGAYAFRQGPAHYAEARTAWEALLARPPAERHYRTVWAAFMLGKLALKEGKPDAVSWFQKTRALAKEGFADSLAMAADSYGWEGRSEWKQGHPDKAARLFLTQLSLGDESAVISLKALIPDRETVEGTLNYGPEFDEREKWTPQQKKEADQKMRAGLRALAADPLLRRLETVHILATETVANQMEEGGPPVARESRIARWFAVLKDAGVKEVDEAEYLGFAAYRLGDYKGAARWLEMAKEGSGVAHWLRAKLQRRGGQLDEAAKSMVLAWEALHDGAKYTGWKPAPLEKKPGEEAPAETGDEASPMGNYGFSAQAGGDLACFKLARGEFMQALDAFVKASMWEDAAFVAESILTADELKTYVDREAPALPSKLDKESAPDRESTPGKLRWMLGRRLVREDRYADAAAYLPPPYDKVLQVYTKALKDGANNALEKEPRARAWFTAAWLARQDGMEIMGTEGAPDGFITAGDFESYAIAQERRTGKFVDVTFDRRGKETKTAKPIPLKPTKEEIDRLNKFKTLPDVRFHYRVIAAALAMKAAALLPDNTPELADVINSAGEWVKDRDNKAADRYYLELKRRCAKTEIGHAALVKKWFVDLPGPWSEREEEEHEKLVPKSADGM